MRKFRETFIGSRAFYRGLITLAVPIIIQQGITNFVNLLDNVMVGRLGTEQLSAVAIVNQLFYVFNLSIFGGLSGASIFGAQFFGKGDRAGVQATFRFKILFSVLLSAGCIGLMLWQGDGLISMFLSESDAQGSLALTLSEARTYMQMMLVGLIPFALSQAYASTLREAGETVAPMFASVLSIGTNLVLNYIFIFGNFGAPAMGVYGAALATVIARFAEALFLILLTHRRHEQFRFVEGLYRSIRIPGAILKKIMITGMPLMFNELLWSLGMTLINQNYSTRGLTVVAAVNISSTAANMFKIIMMAMGAVAAILLGQQLGANQIEEAKKTNYKLTFASVVMHLAIAGVVIAASPFIPLVYNTEAEVRGLATSFLIISAISLPIQSVAHQAYFAIRSGGRTLLTCLFDCVYTWVVPLPLSFVLCRMTDWPMTWIMMGICFAELIKAIVGMILVKSGIWAKNIINDSNGQKTEKIQGV